MPITFFSWSLLVSSRLHHVDDTNRAIPSSLGYLAIPKSMWNGLRVSLKDVWHLSSASMMNSALQEFIATALCQTNPINAPSFLLLILSQIFPPFEFKTKDKDSMPPFKKWLEEVGSYFEACSCWSLCYNSRNHPWSAI